MGDLGSAGVERRMYSWKGHSTTSACRDRGALRDCASERAALDVDNFSWGTTGDQRNRTFPSYAPIPSHTFEKMDSLGGMGSFPGDPKTQVMRQVQQEAAMQNARMLVEVSL